MKRLSALQSRSQRTYDSDLESIENPRYPKPDDDEKVKTAPRQSIEPERDIGVNDGGRGGRLLHSDASKVCRRLRCLPQRRRGPAGEITLLGSIGFDGKAVVVCMGRTCAHTGRPHCGTGYVPSRDWILGFPIGAGLEAPKDRKLLPVDAADPAF